MEIWRLAAKFGEILAKIWAIVGQRVDGRLAIGIFLPRKLMSFYGFQESVASWWVIDCSTPRNPLTISHLRPFSTILRQFPRIIQWKSVNNGRYYWMVLGFQCWMGWQVQRCRSSPNQLSNFGGNATNIRLIHGGGHVNCVSLMCHLMKQRVFTLQQFRP